MTPNYTKYGTRWTSHTKYVDIDTGEEITKFTAKQDYLIIKTTKHAKTNINHSKGHIEYTRECRRNPQGKLPYN